MQKGMVNASTNLSLALGFRSAFFQDLLHGEKIHSLNLLAKFKFIKASLVTYLTGQSTR